MRTSVAAAESRQAKFADWLAEDFGPHTSFLFRRAAGVRKIRFEGPCRLSLEGCDGKVVLEDEMILEATYCDSCAETAARRKMEAGPQLIPQPRARL